MKKTKQNIEINSLIKALPEDKLEIILFALEWISDANPAETNEFGEEMKKEGFNARIWMESKRLEKEVKAYEHTA